MTSGISLAEQGGETQTPPKHCDTKSENAISEEKLIERLKEAQAKKVEPEKIEEYVGAKAAYSTLRSGNSRRFDKLQIAYNNPADIPAKDKRKNIIFWTRDPVSKSSKIIGLFFLLDGEVVLFSGELDLSSP